MLRQWKKSGARERRANCQRVAPHPPTSERASLGRRIDLLATRVAAQPTATTLRLHFSDIDSFRAPCAATVRTERRCK